MPDDFISIKRLLFAIHLPTVDGATDMQESIKSLFYNRLLGELELVFNRYNSPDRWLRIDKLELNIGDITLHFSDDELIQRIRQQLIEQLDRLSESFNDSTELTDEDNMYGGNVGMSIATLPPKKTKPKAKEWLSPKDLSLQAFEYFLKRGVLPWNYAENLAALQTQIAQNLLEASALIWHLTRDSEIAPRIVKRLTSQFEEPILARLTAIYYPQQQDFIGMLGQNWAHYFAQANQPWQPKLWWEAVLQVALVQRNSTIDPVPFFRFTATRFAYAMHQSIDTWLRQVYDIAILTPTTDLLIRVGEHSENIPATVATTMQTASFSVFFTRQVQLLNSELTREKELFTEQQLLNQHIKPTVKQLHRTALPMAWKPNLGTVKQLIERLSRAIQREMKGVLPQNDGAIQAPLQVIFADFVTVQVQQLLQILRLWQLDRLSKMPYGLETTPINDIIVPVAPHIVTEYADSIADNQWIFAADLRFINAEKMIIWLRRQQSFLDQVVEQAKPLSHRLADIVPLLERLDQTETWSTLQKWLTELAERAPIEPLPNNVLNKKKWSNFLQILINLNDKKFTKLPFDALLQQPGILPTPQIQQIVSLPVLLQSLLDIWQKVTRKSGWLIAQLNTDAIWLANLPTMQELLQKRDSRVGEQEDDEEIAIQWQAIFDDLAADIVAATDSLNDIASTAEEALEAATQLIQPLIAADGALSDWLAYLPRVDSAMDIQSFVDRQIAIIEDATATSISATDDTAKEGITTALHAYLQIFERVATETRAIIQPLKETAILKILSLSRLTEGALPPELDNRLTTWRRWIDDAIQLDYTELPDISTLSAVQSHIEQLIAHIGEVEQTRTLPKIAEELAFLIDSVRGIKSNLTQYIPTIESELPTEIADELLSALLQLHKKVDLALAQKRQIKAQKVAAAETRFIESVISLPPELDRVGILGDDRVKSPLVVDSVLPIAPLLPESALPLPLPPERDRVGILGDELITLPLVLDRVLPIAPLLPESVISFPPEQGRVGVFGDDTVKAPLALDRVLPIAPLLPESVISLPPEQGRVGVFGDELITLPLALDSVLPIAPLLPESALPLPLPPELDRVGGLGDELITLPLVLDRVLPIAPLLPESALPLPLPPELDRVGGLGDELITLPLALDRVLPIAPLLPESVISLPPERDRVVLLGDELITLPLVVDSVLPIATLLPESALPLPLPPEQDRVGILGDELITLPLALDRVLPIAPLLPESVISFPPELDRVGILGDDLVTLPLALDRVLPIAPLLPESVISFPPEQDRVGILGDELITLPLALDRVLPIAPLLPESVLPLPPERDRVGVFGDELITLPLALDRVLPIAPLLPELAIPLPLPPEQDRVGILGDELVTLPLALDRVLPIAPLLPESALPLPLPPEQGRVGVFGDDAGIEKERDATDNTNMVKEDAKPTDEQRKPQPLRFPKKAADKPIKETESSTATDDTELSGTDDEKTSANIWELALSIIGQNWQIFIRNLQLVWRNFLKIFAEDTEVVVNTVELSGDTVSGLGDTAELSGDTVSGLGDTAELSGDTVSGLGDTAELSGDTVSGLVNTAELSGDTVSGLGDTAELSGDTLETIIVPRDIRYDKYRHLLESSNDFERQWGKYLQSFEQADSGLLYFNQTTSVPYRPNKELSNEEGEEIYIENAGLVLLWVYLGYFFRDLQLLDKGKFIDEAAQQRAVHLLQYVATEKENVAENMLPLNKILCGMPFDEPIESNITFSDTEKEATVKLIASAIKNWTALKSTSVEGYRDAFIRREGRLTYTPDGWRLLVTPKTYDILLNYLPYGISLIRQSWMTENLWVEWV